MACVNASCLKYVFVILVHFYLDSPYVSLHLSEAYIAEKLFGYDNTSLAMEFHS